MYNKDEILTYEIIQERKKEQDRLIAEGKMVKPQIVDDVFTEEDWVEFNKGITWEHVFGNKRNNTTTQ